MSPERNDRYQIDNVGLQVGLVDLGLYSWPIDLLGEGVSLANNPYNSAHWQNSAQWQNANRGRGGNRRPTGGGQWDYPTALSAPKKVEVQQTYDGIPIRTLYIANIAIEVQHSELKDIFRHFGKIMKLYLGISKNDRNKQFAFITFANPMDAARALSQKKFQDMNGRWFYASAGDSWHQPREKPDGTIDWTPGRKTDTTQDEGSEEELDQPSEETLSRVQMEINEGSLNMLNDDCLLHIFSFLSFKEVTAVERVCKRWQALSFRMWRCLHELSFRKGGRFDKMPCNTKVLDQYLKRCGSSLTSLDLITKNGVFNEVTLAVVAKHCKDLEVLKVSNISVANRSLAYLGRSCTRLKQLIMDGCHKVNDNDLNSLLPKCPGLKDLEFSSNLEFTGKCLANIRSPMTKLQLSDLPAMEPQHLIKGLQKFGGTLESVALNNCRNVPRNSDAMKEIVAACPNLTSFSLSRSMLQFDTHTLISIGDLKKLTSLNLHHNNAVNDKALAAIVEGCEQLTYLNLSGSGGGCAGVLSETGISMLARLRKLTHLDISYLEATNDIAMKNFTSRNCKLKILDCRGCPELSDEGTEAVVTSCNDLELFDVSGCRGVTKKTAETAITSVRMRTNNTPLQLIVGGTSIKEPVTENDVPLLKISLEDTCDDHLRPDFMDDMFFPPSDSDEDEDLDHLCERIAFMFGDLWEEILPSDYDDYDSDDEFDSDIENFYII